VHELVTFDASASTPDGGTIISYVWNFGDGTPIVETNQPVVTHVYTETGDYLVTLNVTDSEGRWDTETRTITVVPKRYYLKVTDAAGNTAQSDPARVTVSSVPVGGYSVPLAKNAPTTPTIAYTLLIVMFGSLLSLTKRKR
jgi:PKD repeat protein